MTNLARLGLREDRDPNGRRPLAGSGSVAVAARVEPSPPGARPNSPAEDRGPLQLSKDDRNLSTVIPVQEFQRGQI